MKTTVHRPLTRAATVPHFVALLGVLREAATRGLSLLHEGPAPHGMPRQGKQPARLGRPLGRAPAH
jgi:hypothetical protein